MSDDYQPENFYMRATDKRGHREQLRATNLDPELHAIMGIAMGSGAFPYKTFGDMVRDAIYHRSRYWIDVVEDPQLKADMKKKLDIARLISEREAAAAHLEEQRKLVDLVCGQLSDGFYQGLGGKIDVKSIRDAYMAIDSRDLAADFERRLERAGITTSMFDDLED